MLIQLVTLVYQSNNKHLSFSIWQFNKVFFQIFLSFSAGARELFQEFNSVILNRFFDQSLIKRYFFWLEGNFFQLDFFRSDAALFVKIDVEIGHFLLQLVSGCLSSFLVCFFSTPQKVKKFAASFRNGATEHSHLWSNRCHRCILSCVFHCFPSLVRV